MKRVIRHLRGQPERVRIQILYILTIASALILVIIWANDFGVDASEPDTGIKEGIAPFSILKDNITEGVESIETPW